MTGLELKDLFIKSFGLIKLPMAMQSHRLIKKRLNLGSGWRHSQHLHGQGSAFGEVARVGLNSLVVGFGLGCSKRRSEMVADAMKMDTLDMFSHVFNLMSFGWWFFIACLLSPDPRSSLQNEYARPVWLKPVKLMLLRLMAWSQANCAREVWV